MVSVQASKRLGQVKTRSCQMVYGQTHTDPIGRWVIFLNWGPETESGILKNMRPRPSSPQLRLVLYSGGQKRSNHILHREVVRLAFNYRESLTPIQKRKRASQPLSLTYIPFMADGSAPYFQRAMRRYRAVGIERFFILEPDHLPSREELQTLLQSDVIYLAGGNTYTFLHLLRKSKLISPLRKYALQGGVLAGLSAGALILTSSIGLAGVPSYDADENELKLQTPAELEGLGLLPFEFSPHDTLAVRRTLELTEYCSRFRTPIFAATDGSGLVIDEKRIFSMGQVRYFSPHSKKPLLLLKKNLKKAQAVIQSEIGFHITRL